MKHHDHHQHGVRLFMCIIFTALLATSCGTPPETYTIGVLNPTSGLDDTVKGFKKGMTELGYIEGENITYIYEGAANGLETLDLPAQRLVKEDVDLILSVTTPATQAAQRATANTDIPVVFVPVTDPVGAGIVKSLKRPGGNITGITFGRQEGRRLEWLLQIAPGIEQIYIPYNPEDRSAVLALEMVTEAAMALDVELITRKTRTPEEITAAIKHIPEEVDAIFLLPDTLLGDYGSEFAKLHLPTSAVASIHLTAHGVLTSYGFDHTTSGKQAAHLADQIFQGVKPANLPVEMAEFHLAINLRAAEALGLDISDEILLQADIIIR